MTSSSWPFPSRRSRVPGLHAELELGGESRISKRSHDALVRNRRAMPESCYRFGRIELHPIERKFLIDGEPVKLGSRAFDVLL